MIKAQNPCHPGLTPPTNTHIGFVNLSYKKGDNRPPNKPLKKNGKRQVFTVTISRARCRDILKYMITEQTIQTTNDLTVFRSSLSYCRPLT